MFTYRKELFDFAVAHLTGDDEPVEEKAEDGHDHLEDGVNTQEHKDRHNRQRTPVGIVLNKHTVVAIGAILSNRLIVKRKHKAERAKKGKKE
jgi:hypothetical protein